VDGADLKFTPVASTRRACLAAEAQQVEASFLKALETTTPLPDSGRRLALIRQRQPHPYFQGGREGRGRGDREGERDGKGDSGDLHF
jgi:heat shock protein HslJ